MKRYILAAITLAGVFHCGSSEGFVEGYLVFHDGSKCVGITNSEPTSVDLASDDYSGCGVFLLSAVTGVAAPYILADASDTTNQLTLPDTQGKATLSDAGTSLEFSKGDTSVDGISVDDATAVTNMTSPFLIKRATTTGTACLDSDLTYKISNDAENCTNVMWYIRTMTCETEQCNTCNLGPTNCTACNDMYALDSNKTCIACTTADEHCKACDYNGANPPVLECSDCNNGYSFNDSDKSCEGCSDEYCTMCQAGVDMCTHCQDMYALNPEKACIACNTADANCKACDFNSASPPALECSDCNNGYSLKDADKSCEACSDRNCAMCKGGVDMCTDCKDMYALDSSKACLSCSENIDNCKECAYNNASPPVLECSGCKDGYKLKDSDKTCEKSGDDDENNGVMQTASTLVVMVTAMLALLQMHNY